MEKFRARKFKALVDEYGYDDVGMSGLVYKVHSLKKDKIYSESNPDYIQGNSLGVVIDDNGCWNYVSDKNFKSRFKEVTEAFYRDKAIEKIIND